MTKSNTTITDGTFSTTRNDTTLLRLPQVLEIIPVSKSTWWKVCKEGHYPQPVYPSPRTAAWRKDRAHGSGVKWGAPPALAGGAPHFTPLPWNLSGNDAAYIGCGMLCHMCRSHVRPRRPQLCDRFLCRRTVRRHTPHDRQRSIPLKRTGRVWPGSWKTANPMCWPIWISPRITGARYTVPSHWSARTRR